MAITTFLGCTLLGTSSAIYFDKLNRGRRALKKSLHEIFEIIGVETKKGDIQTGVQIYRPRIYRVKKRVYGYDLTVQLPKGYTVSQFRKQIEAIEQETESVIRMEHTHGRELSLRLGMLPLFKQMPFTPDMAVPGKPVVPYYTPFGRMYLDFWDDNTCHIIVAGATRMGKSVFLRLLFTNIMLSMNGHVQFFYINNKRADSVPFKGIPQIPRPAATIADAMAVVMDVLKECERRKAILDKADDCVNIQDYRKKHGNGKLQAPVHPVFVVIDEYGRFADNDDFQNIVQEIAETAGYLDVHLVIGTQRPDASTVLKPRIRGNILPRVCFQTADESNSRIVVHTEAAFHLDRIQGRAIVDEGFPDLAHVPYVSEEQAEELLRVYRSDNNDTQFEGFSNPHVPEEIPSLVERPTGATRMPRSRQAGRNNKPNHETAGQRKSRLYGTPTKR